MTAIGQDSLNTRRTLTVEGKQYEYFSLPEAAQQLGDISRLPVSLKVLLENVLRFENGGSYKVDDAKAIAGWLANAHSEKEVPFRPARILMQDFTGVPGGGRPGRHARWHHAARRQPGQGEPADPGRSGDRPLGDGRCLCPARRPAEECRYRVRA